jgi:hypothetical protein
MMGTPTCGVLHGAAAAEEEEKEKVVVVEEEEVEEVVVVVVEEAAAGANHPEHVSAAVGGQGLREHSGAFAASRS